ncbi:MAG: hypothetical protein ACFN38_09545, partial [Campylobacter sp.]
AQLSKSSHDTSPYRFAFKFGVKFKAELVFFRCGKTSKFATLAATFSAMKFDPPQVGAAGTQRRNLC